MLDPDPGHLGKRAADTGPVGEAAGPEMSTVSCLTSRPSTDRRIGLFGYRLRPELGATFETLPTLLDATMRGLVIMALPTPELACPPGAGKPIRGGP